LYAIVLYDVRKTGYWSMENPLMFCQSPNQGKLVTTAQKMQITGSGLWNLWPKDEK